MGNQHAAKANSEDPIRRKVRSAGNALLKKMNNLPEGILSLILTMNQREDVVIMHVNPHSRSKYSPYPQFLSESMTRVTGQMLECK